MNVVNLAVRAGNIDGLLIVTMKQVADDRGTVRELFRRSAFDQLGISISRIDQINVTETSLRGAVRGMHAEAMTKLVAVAYGRAHGLYVDMRRDSPTFANVDEVELVAGTQVLVPAGVANGFQALEDGCQYAYCFDREWAPDMPGEAFSPLDPIVADRWPLPFDRSDRRLLSLKDAQAAGFHEVVNS